jgi:hypothetical protein
MAAPKFGRSGFFNWVFFFFFFLVKKRKKRCLDRLEISPGFLSLLSVMGVKLATGNKMWRRE